jgi:hypothetical protein
METESKSEFYKQIIQASEEAINNGKTILEHSIRKTIEAHSRKGKRAYFIPRGFYFEIGGYELSYDDLQTLIDRFEKEGFEIITSNHSDGGKSYEIKW